LRTKRVHIALFDILSNDATVASLVGTRIYPVSAPREAAMPYIVTRIIANRPSDTKDGVSTVDYLRVSIDVVAQDTDQALEIDDAVRQALDRFSGTANGVNVTSAQYISTLEDWNWVDERYEVTSDYHVRIA